MIEQVRGGFTGFDIECDSCGLSIYLDYYWDNLQGAIAEAKSDGWKIERVNDEWRHMCPECRQKEEK